ncbi:hypothetical protein COV19_05595 [Candidatus Woesearchaeota archaeon CG10_big_fil_rev_8_21_14_0_10_44_13]|nr:MAG: hypothetical protein COV19_05595 [Candidatus Woesearchaeota archaeon CG10_big_fil_rev_8_21_14_0_10_44_13]
MAQFKVTDKDIRSLEDKADSAYRALKQGVETSDIDLIDSAEELYGHLLDNLHMLTMNATESIKCLRKGGKRAEPIEKFILQCLLIHKSPTSLYDDGRYQTSIVPDGKDGMGGLKAYLDADDGPDYQKAEMFRLIQNKAEEIRERKAFDMILNAVEYVREKYSAK